MARSAAGARRRGGTRKGGRGRSLVALILVGFLLVTSGIVWRRTYGTAQSRQIRDLDRRRAQLEALRAKLESDVREASSRTRLAPVAEQQLGMHVPGDSQVVILPRRRARAAGARAGARP